MFIYSEDEIREVVEIDADVIEVIEQGFSKLAAGDCTMPPILRVDIPENNGEVDVKTAYIRGYDQFAIKVSSGFFDNYKRGLPTGNGLMMLISTETGVPQAILLDNGYLTDVRTAAAGAVAAKHLARQQIQTVGVIGAGTQARFQMQILQHVRNFSQILIYAPTEKRVKQFVTEMQPMLNVDIKVANSIEEVVRDSDMVVTTTPAREPLIKAEWLHPGLHITAMGSDAEHKQELESAVFHQADRIVCDVKSQCFHLGELHHAINQGILSETSDITELGEITSGAEVGRQSEAEITICDLTGTGVQDTAIALFAFEKLASTSKRAGE